MSEIWGNLSEPTAITLESNIAGEVITKDEIRQQVWDFLEQHELVNFPRPVHHRIPNFKGAATAGQKLPSLEEFRNASVIKVNPDKPQEEVRYQVLDHKKTLLVPTPRLRTGLLNLLDHPGGDSDNETLRKLASRQGIDNHSKPLPMDTKIKIDVVVLGCVAVDKLGHRVGKGEGFADLEFAMGVTLGAITPDTIVIATVHDCQLFDTLPEEIFGEHDVPVDIIVTPTVIHVVKERLPKPNGIIWSILSADKFRKIPVLKQMRLKDSEGGKEVSLKERSLSEQNGRRDRDMKKNGDRAKRNDDGENRSEEKSDRNDRRRRKVEDEENDEYNEKSKKGDSRASDNETEDKPKKGKPRGRENRNTDQTKFEDDEENDRDMEKHKGSQKQSKRAVNDNDDLIQFDDRPMFYIGKIPKDARVRDLKEVIVERGVKPKEVRWKGYKGFAFVYFDKTQTVDELFDALSELKIGEKLLDVQKEKYFED